jgi:O-antigen ligase
LAVSAALSIAFGLFLPSYGIAHGVNDGAWQGIYTQKNVFGQMMLFGALIFQSVLGRSRLSRLLGWIGIGVTILLIALSQSVSAFVCFAAVNLTMALLRRFRQRRLRSVFVVVTVCTLCTAALLVSTDRDVALGMVGKDATLTGRTEIWAAVMDRIAERPLLGYGYGAFWLRGSGPGEWVRQAIRWETPHSHNGYLDVAADLGLLGLSILIGALVHAWYRAWQRWRPELGASEDWPLALLLCVLLIDAVQSPLASSDFVWVLVVGVGAAALDELPVPATRRSVEIHRFRKAEVV